MALALEPAYGAAEVARLRDEAREALRLLELRPGLSPADAQDVRQLARTAALGGQLTGPDLIAIAKTLAVVQSFKANLTRLADALPVLASVAAGLADVRDLEASIRAKLSPQGDVLDSASELLARLRLEERAAHERLLARLKEFIASADGRRVLQEPFITTRDDRYVLAVKAEHRGQVQGLIHDLSSSGATVFMEPLAAVELGNAWRELSLAERREVERILRELAAVTGERAEAIEESIDRLARIDLALAKARMGRALDGAVAEIIEPGPPAVRLRDARHPLLPGRAVPISVEIGRDFRALVISGPNTGGKTVALKTVGLLALMAQAGIPIPAEAGSALQSFDGIYADIGDEQSIEQSLSTFSAHLRTIVDVLACATARSLVLLDELGAGTDPQEGSAVAKAILSELVRRGAATVVTTHHGEIKAFAQSAPGVANASVEFDAETLAPTYRLVVGLPGRSNALAIAERLGLPPGVLEEARASLGSGAAQVEAMLSDIEEQRRKAQAERAAAETARQEIEQVRAGLEQRLRALEAERQGATQIYQVEVQVMAEELKSRLRHARRRLNALVGERGQQELTEIAAEVDAVRAALERAPWQTDGPAEPGSAEPVLPGDLIRVEGVGQPAEVLSGPDERGRVQVQAGPVRLEVHRSRIRGKEPRPAPAPKPGVVVAKGAAARAAVGTEFWVHGMRAQQAVEAVDEYLEKAALADHHRVRIIHGKGRGVLRSAIQRALGDHPLVGLFHDAPPDEGGEGVTIVEL